MNRYLIVMALVFIVHTQASPKNFTPNLKRLRDKVEHALESTHDGHKSFKDLIQQAHMIEGESSHVVRLVGADGVKSDREKLEEIDQEIKGLYWSHQGAAMLELYGLSNHHKNKALSGLVEVVQNHYHEHKTPVIAFAVALEKEVEVLAHCREQLRTLLSVRSSREALTSEFQDKILHDLYVVNDLEQKMSDFITFVDQILRGL